VPFFGLAGNNLPPPQNDDFLAFQNAEAALDHVEPGTFRLLQDLELTMNNNLGVNEASVDTFFRGLLYSIGYANPAEGRQLIAKRNIRFWVCGKKKQARPDHSIRDANKYVLLVIEDKAQGSTTYPRVVAQLIAQAIAAFQINNQKRQELHLNTLDDAIIPGIIMIGSSPAFFNIPVTTELVHAVEFGQFPPQPTIVHMHRPQVAVPHHYNIDGMVPIANWIIILSSLEAFRVLHNL
jgi:hypothetical protein